MQPDADVRDAVRRHHAPFAGGHQVQARAEEVGWKQAVRERDLGTFDWTDNRPINAPK